MKTIHWIVLIFGIPALASAEKTTAELQKELDLAQAKLAVAEAKIKLAAAESALAKVAPEPDNPRVSAESPPTEPPQGGTGESSGEKLPKKATTDIKVGAWPRASAKEKTIFFHTGVRVLTPFKIDPATKKISSDNTETGGFVEAVATNIWAWQPDMIGESRALYARAVNAKNASLDGKVSRINQPDPTMFREDGVLKDYDWQFVDTIGREGWDYVGRLSFEFGADKEASAATITGSGDVSAEVSAVKHLFRGWTPSGAWSLGLGGAVSAVTDRKARKVHRSLMAGLMSNSSFTVGENHRLALLRIGFGYGSVEGVVYDDPTQDTIKFDGTVPKFESRWQPATTAELWWPMGDATYLTMGARLYGKSKPDQWTLYLGTTIDLPAGIASLSPKKEKK